MKKGIYFNEKEFDFRTDTLARVRKGCPITKRTPCIEKRHLL